MANWANKQVATLIDKSITVSNSQQLLWCAAPICWDEFKLAYSYALHL